GSWDDSIYANMFHVLNAKSNYPQRDELPKVVPWLLWRLWKSRNEFIFKGKDFDAQDTVRKALEDAEEWNQRKGQDALKDRQPTLRASNEEKWRPPPRCWVKCNTDVAWNGEDTQSGMGWVLRNCSGEVLWMGAQALRRTRSALEVELEAIRWAVTSMLRLDFQKIIFESDSLVLVNLLNNDENWPAFAPLIQDIKDSLPLLEDFKIVYTPRGCNGVADRVAKESLSFENYDPKLYSLMPNWIQSNVMVDKPSVL
ncbi:hypothetical protein CARUB_v10002590mg, partial [Capsella rubella]